MSTARKDHGVAAVNGKLYAMGRFCEVFLSSVECFDPSTGSGPRGCPWTKLNVILPIECPVDVGSKP